MKSLLCTVVLCALFGGVAVANVQAQNSDRDAVIAVVEAVASFSQAKNLEAMDTLFAPEQGVHIHRGCRR